MSGRQIEAGKKRERIIFFSLDDLQQTVELLNQLESAIDGSRFELQKERRVNNYFFFRVSLSSAFLFFIDSLAHI